MRWLFACLISASAFADCPSRVETDQPVSIAYEIARRAIVSRLELTPTAAGALVRHFPRVINLNSKRIEVGTESSLAGQLVRLLKGLDAQTAWKRVANQSYPYPLDDEQVVGVLESPEDGPYLVACVNLGAASLALQDEERECQPVPRVITPKISKAPAAFCPRGPTAYACYFHNDQT